MATGRRCDVLCALQYEEPEPTEDAESKRDFGRPPTIRLYADYYSDGVDMTLFACRRDRNTTICRPLLTMSERESVQQLPELARPNLPSSR